MTYAELQRNLIESLEDEQENIQVLGDNGEREEYIRDIAERETPINKMDILDVLNSEPELLFHKSEFETDSLINEIHAIISSGLEEEAIAWLKNVENN
jgi:hypothetical protein